MRIFPSQIINLFFLSGITLLFLFNDELVMPSNKNTNNVNTISFLPMNLVKAETSDSSYREMVLGILKGLKHIFERIKKSRLDRGDQVGAKRLEAFVQSWISSWTGIPALLFDYVKYWMINGAQEAEDFKEMKKHAQLLAKIIQEIFQSDNLTKRGELLKKRMMNIQGELKEVFDHTLNVFKSGYINSCLNQIRTELSDQYIFRDIINLSKREADILLRILGRTLRGFDSSRPEKDEL